MRGPYREVQMRIEELFTGKTILDMLDGRMQSELGIIILQSALRLRCS